MNSQSLEKLVTIGICAFNEERNIKSLIENIMHQNLNFPKEVIVVSDGSTDSTTSIVHEISKKESAVRLVSHKNRRGRSEAISTLFKESKGDIIVIVSADTQLCEGSIQEMVDVFDDPSIGICWAKLVPIYEKHLLANRLGVLAFRLHDKLSMKLRAENKLKHVTGDIISIRREVFTSRPSECVNDDEYLAIQTVRKGFRVHYLPKILYRTPMPRTISDYVNQRRRWVYGHHQVKKMLGEYPSVLECILLRKPRLILSIIIEEIADRPDDLIIFFASLIIELSVGMLVLRDILLQVKHSTWQMIESTKRPVANSQAMLSS